jgi:hypothetical protein
MRSKEKARCAVDFRGPQHAERQESGFEAAIGDSTTSAAVSSADEEALRLAREWRVGKGRVWSWWVGRLQERLASGKGYASMRSFTDDVGQNHDFVDDDGHKVSVPHDRGLGRGIALLMVEEHAEFRPLFRMRGASDGR